MSLVCRAILIPFVDFNNPLHYFFPPVVDSSVAELAGDGDVAQLVEHRTGTPLRQVRFLGAARDLSPRLSYGVPTALACNRMH